MIDRKLILKISEGLYESSKQNNMVSIYKEELKFLLWTLQNNKELYDYLKSPFINSDEKDGTLDAIFDSLLINEMKIFLKYVVNNNLITSFKDICDEFLRLSNIDENTVVGTLYTPFHIDDNRHKMLEDALSEKIHKKVILKEQIEDTLICGIRVMVDENIYEYSINSRLEDIKSNLINDLYRGDSND